MPDETRLVRLWQMSETPRAIQFSKLPPKDPNTGGVDTHEIGGPFVWIPRSLIEHISRDPKLPCGWVPCNVRLQEWKAEELGL